MADIGRLNKRVTFYKQQPVVNPSTHFTSNQMTEFKTVWASVECKSGNRTGGNEYQDAGRTKNKLIWDVYVRYNADLDNADMEIHALGRKFNITAVCPADGGRMCHYLCEEVL